MSAFAKTIMDQKYAHTKQDGTKETWDEISSRVSRKVFKAVGAPKDVVKKFEKLMSEKKIMPGGRYLYATGRPFHQVQNCFGGETEVVTLEGTKTLKELSGTIPTLMTSEGKWVKAPVQSFGQQRLHKVVIGRAGVKKEVFATEEHSWRIARNESRDGRPATKEKILTKDLKEGQKLWSVYGYGISRTPLSPAGVQHGLVYGDGNVPKDDWGFNTANIRLCGEKNTQLLNWFNGYNTRNIESDVEVSGLPRHYKDPVSLKSDRSYLLGWLAGYMAADGCVSADGVITISSTDLESLKLVKDVCYLLGVGAYSIRFSDRTSNLTGEPSRLYSVCLMRHTLPSDFFLVEEHKRRFEAHPAKRSECSWTVLSVEPTDRTEEVFCAVVEDTHEFVLADNILTGNCLLLKADDSREGWADLMQKATMALMTGAGIGVVYSDVRGEGAPIRKTGGTSTGPIALMQMINEAGRGIMQGGSRRSAIWAGLHWNHPDIIKFVNIKNWPDEVVAMKAKDVTFPAMLDNTNISVILDDDFFAAYSNPKHNDYSLAQNVYWATVKQMLKTAEPGFSIDVGINNGENLRNAPVSGNTWIMTKTGYTQVKMVVGKEVEVWTGKQWAKTTFTKTKDNVPTVNIEMSGGRNVVADLEHEFFVETYKGAGDKRVLQSLDKIKASDLKVGDILHVSLPMPNITEFDNTSYLMGFLYGDGSFRDNRADLTICTPEKLECMANFVDHQWITNINKEDGRGYTRLYLKSDTFLNRTKETFPTDITNANSMASFVAGLFDSDGSYDLDQNRIRLASNHKGFLEAARRALETLGIQSGITTSGISQFGNNVGYLLVINSGSVNRFKETIPTTRLKVQQNSPYRDTHIRVTNVLADENQDVFCCDVKVDEHSFMAEGVVISNCTEVSSKDDSDICNLASINMANVNSLEEMKEIVELSTMFLLAGTVYSDVPYAKVDQIRTKNRRLGLGLMGLHEWLLKRGKAYGPDAELEEYLKVYATSTDIAKKYAKEWKLSAPVKTRAIAPTGTIGIVAETTTGIEPIFCVAYRRRYMKGSVVNFQYVIDPCAQRLIDSGVSADKIEDAYSLAENVENRVKFQAWVQKFVDHGISSTINLPEWGSELNNDQKVRPFGEMLMKYLPELRGVTCYPDGARGGQPLTPVKYATAIKHLGEIFVEQADLCDLTKGGSCGA